MKRRKLLREQKQRLLTFYGKSRNVLRMLLAAVLTVCVILQCGLLWRSMMPEPTKEPEYETRTDNSAGALPVRFAARGETGIYGVEYNPDGLKEAYENTAELWAQALSCAEEPSAVRMKEYRKALGRDMLMMEYDGAVPVEILAGWLDCTVNDYVGSNQLGTVVLCSGEGSGYELYFRDSATGTISAARTEVEDEAFDAAVEQFEPNSCTLSADDTEQYIVPDLLYFKNHTTLDVMSFRPYDGRDGMEILLNAFGMDADVAMERAYLSGGRKVYVSGVNSIRLAEDGSMVFDGTGPENTASGIDRTMQCVQTAYRVSGEALEALDSGAAPALTRAYTDEETGRYVVVFGMQINSVPVDNDTGYFGRYEFENGVLVHANLTLRTCQSTGEIIAVLPAKQAAASIEADSGMRLSLRYVDETASAEEPAEDEQDETDEDDAALPDEQDVSWEDDVESIVPDESSELQPAWYDNTGTPIAPRWYILHHGYTPQNPGDPDSIDVVTEDFDERIQGGGAA